MARKASEAEAKPLGPQVVEQVRAYRANFPEAPMKEAIAVVAAQLGTTVGGASQAYYRLTKAERVAAPPTDPPPDGNGSTPRRGRPRRPASAELLDLLARAEAMAERIERDTATLRSALGEIRTATKATATDLAAREEHVRRVEEIVSRVASQP